MNRRELLIPWEAVKQFIDENEIVGTQRHINKYLDLIESYFPNESLLSVREVAARLDLSRLSVERRFIKGDLPHYEVKFSVRKADGSERKSAPRDRLYIKAVDLLAFMIDSCGLQYEQNTVEIVPFRMKKPFKDMLSRKFAKSSYALMHRRERFPVASLPEDQQAILLDLLLRNGWTSMLRMQDVTQRSRSSMVLLSYMTDAVLLPIAGKNARRFLVKQKVPLHSGHVEKLLREAFRLPFVTPGMVYGSEPIRFVSEENDAEGESLHVTAERLQDRKSISLD